MWMPRQQYLINKIEKIQHQAAARYVTSDYDLFNSVTQHISNVNVSILRWETLEDCCNKSRLYVL